MEADKKTPDTCPRQNVEAAGDKGSPASAANRSNRTDNTAPIKSFSKRDWDKIIQDFEKEEEQEQSMDDLFKQIYSTGSEEVRKAMNKSFQESGGTVLSTNWKEVANKKVEPKPPSDNDA